MAAKAVSNFKKILLGVFLCAAAGLGQFFLMGASPARVDENEDSREAAVTLTKTPAPRFTLTTTVELSMPEQIRATEGVLFFDCGWANRRINSDDSEWTAVNCVGNAIGVYKPKNLSKKYYIKYFDVYGKDYENGNHDGKLTPVHFSKDHQSFYFSPYLVGDGGCPMYGWNYALFRLDLKTGSIVDQVSPEENAGFNFAFSNDDKYLAYIYSNNSLPDLHIQDLNNNTQTVIPIYGVYSEAGSMLWSPDDSQLVFTARTGEDCNEMNYSVISLDTKNFDQKVLVQGSAKMILPVRWIDGEHILVLTGFNTVYSILNITTGELEPESHPEAIPTGLAY
jgi:hypothetical protein